MKSVVDDNREVNTRYIQELKRQIELKQGRSISTSAEIKKLTNDINDYFRVQKQTHSLSLSTIKRFYKAVKDEHNPYTSTLDILSRFLGYDGFRSFCRSVDNEQLTTYVSKDNLFAADLNVGDRVEVGWNPNCRILFRYDGNNLFTILETNSTKLQVGDSSMITQFKLGFPLCLPFIQHDEVLVQQSLVLGLKCGLNLINLLNGSNLSSCI